MSSPNEPPPVVGDSAQVAFPCEQCGGELHFKPGADALTCPYCGHRQAIASAPGHTIVEHDFAAGLARVRRAPASEVHPGAVDVSCPRCGAQARVSGQADHCAFCGSPVVLAQQAVAQVIVPESLLPFNIEARAVRELFVAWVRALWFAPNNLRKLARSQRVDGVYLPYWAFDSQTQTVYRGQRGEAYYESETYTDAQGKQQTRRVRKVRWYPCSGTVSVAFDDLLVCASTSLPPNLIQSLEPWDLPALRPFDPAYLSGFVAERAAVDLEQGFVAAQSRMQPVIESAIEHDIGGDEQRILSFDTRHADTRFKHLLLPLWVSSFWYKDKVYRFVCNARTGEISGERPYSALKIFFAVLLGLIVVAIVVWLWQRQRS